MPQSHCAESTPKRGQMDHSSLSGQGLTLSLALWPMATKNSVWATNFQAALAQMDQ